MIRTTVLITGASSGIGKELAYICAHHNHNLLLVARNKQALLEIATEIQQMQKDIQIHLFECDLSVPHSAHRVYAYCQTLSLKIDILINNAGFGDFGYFIESQLKKQIEMIQLNITSLVELCHLFLPNMKANGYGKILNVASTASFQPGPMMSVYFATKSFVLHFSEAIANELEGTGITVTALCPGATESGFQRAASMEQSGLVKGKKMPTSKEVAQFGYEKMMQGRKVAIHGSANYIMANAVRIVPRAINLKIVRFLMERK